MKPFPLIFAALALALLVHRRRRLEGESKVLLIVLVAGLVVYGTGVVHIPNLEKLLEDIGGGLGKWTYLLVGALAFAETGAFLGFVAPGEFAVLLGGLVAGQGKINVIALLAIVWACAALGDFVSYELGRRLGREFLVKHGARVKITEARLTQVEGFFERRGGLTILIGRFLGLVRPISPFLAGSSRMPLRRFVPVDVLAAGLWSTTFVMVGYVFWQSFDQVVVVAKKGAFGLGAAAAVIVGVMVVYRQMRQPENRARVEAWLEQRVVYRVVVKPVARTLSGPVRFVWHRLTPGDLGLELTTLLAVAAVGSFAFVGYAIVLHGVDFTPGDLRALHWSRSLHSRVGVDVAKVLTYLGSLSVVGPVTGLTTLWLLSRRRYLDAAVLVSGLLLTILGVHIAKAASDRPRPLGELVHTHGSSWPSAHAAYVCALVAVAVAIARTMGTARFVIVVVAALVAGILVGASRIYLRAHFLSDVLSGYGLAATIFSLCAVVAVIADFVRHNVKTAS